MAQAALPLCRAGKTQGQAARIDKVAPGIRWRMPHKARINLPMKLLNLLEPTYLQMLGSLSGWLRKAGDQLPPEQAEALLSARLADDMFPLSTQVRFACVQAIEGTSRLTGAEFPPLVAELLEEGRNAETSPGSIADATARIDETIALVKSLAEGAASPEGDAPIAHVLPSGMIFDFSGEQYARDWAIGQFYFHLMIAYAILRHKGVALGKADYVAHLLGHLRPGTLPTG